MKYAILLYTILFTLPFSAAAEKPIMVPLSSNDKAVQEQTAKIKSYTDAFAKMISADIAAHLNVPQEAVREGMAGQVMIHLKVDREGNLLEHEIAQKTEFPVLNEAVETALKKAAPFTVPKDSPLGSKDKVNFQIPITFEPSTADE